MRRRLHIEINSFLATPSSPLRPSNPQPKHLATQHAKYTALFPITCEALNEGRLLDISTNRQDKNFILAPWCEGGESILSCSADKVKRRKYFHIVEEQLDLVLVDIPISSCPCHPKVLSAPVLQREILNSLWDYKKTFRESD